jgi:hypothetical protein
MTEQPMPPSDEPADPWTPQYPQDAQNPQYPQNPPPPGPGPYGYVVYQQPPLNTNALLALVLGAMVLPPLGIYFGYKAREEIARTGQRGSELATAGIVVGWVLTGLFVVAVCGFCLLGAVVPNR